MEYMYAPKIVHKYTQIFYYSVCVRIKSILY